MADLFGVDASAEAQAMPLDPKLEGFRNAASSLLPSDLRIEGYALQRRPATRRPPLEPNGPAARREGIPLGRVGLNATLASS